MKVTFTMGFAGRKVGLGVIWSGKRSEARVRCAVLASTSQGTGKDTCL